MLRAIFYIFLLMDFKVVTIIGFSITGYYGSPIKVYVSHMSFYEHLRALARFILSEEIIMSAII